MPQTGALKIEMNRVQQINVKSAIAKANDSLFCYVAYFRIKYRKRESTENKFQHRAHTKKEQLQKQSF